MTKSHLPPLASRLFTRLKNNIANRNNWLCLCAGLSLVLAYAPFSYWYLALIVPSVVFYLINKSSPKQAAKYVGIFAFGWFASGISWVHVSIDEFGGLPIFVSIGLMLLLCIYLAIFPAFSAYLAAYFSKNKKLNLWLLTSFWLVTEYLRAVVLTGFPWLSLGYSQVDSPLANYAPIIGEVGITALILLINICLVKIITAIKQYKSPIFFVTPAAILIVIASIALLLAQKNWVSTTGKIAKVALVQGNIEQAIKWAPEQEWPTLLKYLDLTRVNYEADIIIWPESAIPAVEPSVQDYLTTVNRSALLNNSAIITGIINYNFETKQYFNSLIVLGKKNLDDEQGYFYNHSNRYSKHHLLPIGEFVPFQEWLRPIAPFFNLPMSSFSRGDYQQNNLTAKGVNLLPLLCFEIAFPHQLAANLTNNTDLLLTVSNDAWFGASHGPHQHMEIARMRALEFGRPLLRSTNNGITAVVDHHGKFIKRIPQFEEAVLTTKVPLVEGNTPYSQWPRLILVMMMIIPLLLVTLQQILSNKDERE
ncbi:MAG: apolipoprotein N-acyltransferase [Colwellia sp.]|nr:apolipoprotein N-acyltransferase [Colwellia sp.]MCW8866095.1 apolipoprotein N-acyltransferase [Colwellia sp.]MCW9080748.1 apolipoprotein N-acyltransferase [Colwellia sp.]